MVIYTKRGDKGETGLFRKIDGKSVRVSKSSCNTQAIGTIDEINSYLGIIISTSIDINLSEQLLKIQNNLLTIGSILAGSKLRLRNEGTKELETMIDRMDKKLPVLKNFIYPGGGVIASHLQYARTLARRAEREVVALSELEKIPSSILKYLNRLSDFLFVLARWENWKEGVEEKVWRIV